MDNQDKIINKIKSAAHKAEHKDFPGMEKVWARVEDKLDQRELKAKTKLWKKLAIAASLLLFVSLGYQLLKPTQTELKTNEIIVQKDSVKPIISEPIKEAVTEIQIDTAKITKVLKETQRVAETADKKNEITEPAVVAFQEAKMSPTEETLEAKAIISKKEDFSKAKSSFNSADADVEPDYVGARTAIPENKAKVRMALSDKKAVAKPTAAAAQIAEKVDNAPRSSEYSSAETNNKAISFITELDSLKDLKEALYIINGVEYTQRSLFGKNPTSPYAPLDKQKIESLKILKNEEATAKYGDKGKNGVVIITTENGIPLKN